MRAVPRCACVMMCSVSREMAGWREAILVSNRCDTNDVDGYDSGHRVDPFARDGRTHMHRIGFLISDGFQIMALAAQSVFEYANMGMSEPFYGMAIYSVDGGDVRSSLGLPVATHAARADRRRYVDRRGRQRSARFAGAGRRRRVPAPHQRTRAADRRHLHGRVRAGRSRAARAARARRTGRSAATCSGAIRRSASRTTGSTSSTARSGRRPG